MPVQLKKFWFQRNKSNELVIETFLGHYTLNVRFDNVNFKHRKFKIGNENVGGISI